MTVSLVIHFVSDTNSEKLIKEILKSHVDEIVVDENKTNFEQLAKAMTGLNFKIKKTQIKQLEGARMIGAKYFNSGETIGAQIKYRDDQKRVISLYEFKTEQQLEDLETAIDVDNGSFYVKLWKEKETYFLIVKTLYPSN